MQNDARITSREVSGGCLAPFEPNIAFIQSWCPPNISLMEGFRAPQAADRPSPAKVCRWEFPNIRTLETPFEKVAIKRMIVFGVVFWGSLVLPERRWSRMSRLQSKYQLAEISIQVVLARYAPTKAAPLQQC